jgi:hypothetical protein
MWPSFIFSKFTLLPNSEGQIVVVIPARNRLAQLHPKALDIQNISSIEKFPELVHHAEITFR